jgi:hypothetical protein
VLRYRGAGADERQTAHSLERRHICGNFICDLQDAKAKGFIQKVPHYNSIFNYLENPDLTPILTSLITQSALPLKAIETAFAVDSTGFMTSRFTRWFDKKYGVVKQTSAA